MEVETFDLLVRFSLAISVLMTILKLENVCIRSTIALGILNSKYSKNNNNHNQKHSINSYDLESISFRDKGRVQ